MPFRPSTPDTRNKADWEKVLSKENLEKNFPVKPLGKKRSPSDTSSDMAEAMKAASGRGQNLSGRQPKPRGGGY